MGRRAQYHTVLEKSIAESSYKRKYNATLLGRSQRSAQNRRAYIKANDLPAIVTPTLPNNLLIQSNAYLRATPTFDLHYRILDVDWYPIDLNHYTHLSNYVPPDTCETDTIHSINGRQLSLLEAEGDRRHSVSSSRKGFLEATKMIVIERERMIRGWSRAEAMEVTDDGGMYETIYLLSLEWGARRIVGLNQELEARKESRQVYEAMYNERKLWWQNILVHS